LLQSGKFILVISLTYYLLGWWFTTS